MQPKNWKIWTNNEGSPPSSISTVTSPPSPFTKKFTHFWGQFFVILSIHKPFLGSCEIPQKNWARLILLFWRFSVTNKQAKYSIYNFVFADLQNYTKTNSLKLLKTKLPLTFPGVMWGTTENFVPICSAVLTNIIDGQTIKQKDKQSIFIEEG